MASNIPAELKYTKDHEWALINGNTVTIGITDFAQSSLGDIVFVELPEVGRELSTNQTFGVVESIKSVSDLFSPLSGKVIEVNDEVVSSPELCNSAPYENAWMLKLELSNNAELSGLLSASEYEAFLATL